jgi:Zn-dependent oligopeptidase
MSSPDFDWRKDAFEWPEDDSELPEQAPLNFNHKLRQRAGQLRDSLFKLHRKLPDQIGVQEATATNFLSPLANVLNERSTCYMQVFIIERASSCDIIRVASRGALSIINEIDNELPIQQKLLDAISHVSEVGLVDKEAKEFAEYLLRKVPHSSSSFGSWLKRMIMRTRLHLHLEPKSSPLSEVRRSLEEVNIACQDCINACEVEELNAQDWIRRRNQYNANREQCYGNIERMHRMIALRKEEARILDFHSLAEFKAKGRMGKCTVCIKQLIYDLRKQALESTPTMFDRLLTVKKTTFSWTTWPEDRLALENKAEADILRDWDYAFCTNLGGQLVDWKKLSEYFEVHNTLNVTIQILSNLFGLKFRKVYAGDPDQFSKGLVKVWQEGVKIYSVWNDFENEKDFLGYLYLDLFSREKKTIMPGHYCLQAVRNFLPVLLCGPLRRLAIR